MTDVGKSYSNLYKAMHPPPGFSLGNASAGALGGTSASRCERAARRQDLHNHFAKRVLSVKSKHCTPDNPEVLFQVKVQQKRKLSGHQTFERLQRSHLSYSKMSTAERCVWFTHTVDLVDECCMQMGLHNSTAGSHSCEVSPEEPSRRHTSCTRPISGVPAVSAEDVL